jgi:hypothetical protein
MGNVRAKSRVTEREFCVRCAITWEKAEGTVGTQHHAGKGKWAEMMIWEKLDNRAKNS